MIPQLILTLSPTDTLVAEIPGPNGSRQIIPLDDFQCAAQLRHLLKDQLLKAAAEAYIAHQQTRTHNRYDTEVERLIDRLHHARTRATIIEKETKRVAKIACTISPDDLGI